MALQTFKCLECAKKFAVNEWLCADGVANHVVEEKTYRCLDAPNDPSTRDTELKNGRTLVCNIPPPRRVMEGNDSKWVGEGSVEFIRGRFTTCNPEQQYWLDKRPEYNATEEQWQKVWLSQGQQLAMERMTLDAMKQRIENDRNELLSQTKQRVSA